MVAYTVVDVEEAEPMWGIFRKMRLALGVSGFGINHLRLPPDREGQEHDESELRQEEVYVILAGSGRMVIDGDDVPLVPGTWLRVDADSTRLVHSGSEGLEMIMVGGTPGAPFVHRPSL